ncbi:hypothetical protein FRC08_012441 [Ceratobasidium sp. 394]|nr:hypothetical protein FRC08_012441 [Ceratobasidium sp. 394]
MKNKSKEILHCLAYRCCHVLRRKEHGQKSHIFIAFRTPEDARQAHEDCISDSPNVKWVQDFDSSLGPNRCSDELGAKWQQFVGLPPSPSRTVESLMDFGAKPELGAPADEANLIVSKLWSAIDWRQTLEDQNLGLSEVLDQDIYQHSRAWNRLRDVSKRCEKLANGEELSM